MQQGRAFISDRIELVSLNVRKPAEESMSGVICGLYNRFTAFSKYVILCLQECDNWPTSSGEAGTLESFIAIRNKHLTTVVPKFLEANIICIKKTDIALSVGLANLMIVNSYLPDRGIPFDEYARSVAALEAEILSLQELRVNPA